MKIMGIKEQRNPPGFGQKLKPRISGLYTFETFLNSLIQMISFFDLLQ